MMKFKTLGLFVVISLIAFSGFFLKANQADALALCSTLPDPQVHITLDGQTYNSDTTISTTAGHVFSYSWTADHDIDDTTNGSYYNGHSTGGYHVVSGSGTTDPMPSSGSVSVISVVINIHCEGDPNPIKGGSTNITANIASSCTTNTYTNVCSGDPNCTPDDGATYDSCIAANPGNTCQQTSCYTGPTNKIHCTYSICPGNPPPVNGQCSSPADHNNQCISGGPSGVTNGSNAYTWTCNGSSGGSTASCSEAKTPPPSCTMTADYLAGIDPGNSTGFAVVKWNSSNIPSGDTVEVTRNNPDGTHTSYSYNKVTNTAYPINYGTSTYYFYTSSVGSPLCSASVSASCLSGSTWNGTSCVAAAPVVNGLCSASHYSCTTGTSSGTTGDTSTTWNWRCDGSGGGANPTCTENKPITTGTINGSTSAYATCTIPNGSSTCSTTLTWATVNPISGVTSAITSASGTPSSVSGNNGSQSFSFPYGSNNWSTLYHNGSTLAQAQIVAACASGSSYASGACRADSTVTVSSCPNGTISPGTQTFPYGSSQGYTISANPGYAVSNVVVNGSSIGAVSSYTFNSIAGNQTISSTCVATSCSNGAIDPPSCTTCTAGSVLLGSPLMCTAVTVSVMASPNTYIVAPGAPVSLTYSPNTNYYGPSDTECRLLDSNQSPISSYQPSSPISLTAPMGINDYAYRVQCRNKTVTSATATSNLVIVETNCPAGQSWNGSACVVVSGPSATLSASSCQIANGYSTCISNLSETHANLVNPNGTNTQITRNPAGTCNNCAYPFNPPMFGDISYGNTNFYFYHNGGSPLATATASATCTSGTTWNGSICQGAGPTGTISATNCTIASGASTCSASVSWTTANLTANPTSITRNTGSPASFTPSPLSGGSQTVNLGFGTTTFYLYHNSAELAETSAGAGVATCVSGTTWNGTTCAPSSTPSGTVNATNCTIAVGGSSCSASVSWTTANLTAGATSITRNVGSPNFTPSPLASGSQSVTLGGGTTIFYLYHNISGTPTLLAQTSAGTGVGTCTSGSTWDGTTCVPASGMSGSISATSCTIVSGGSSCNSSISWSTTNPVATSSVTTPTNITVGSGNNSSASYSIDPNGRTFYLYNNGQLLNQASATALCISGTAWNGTTCAVVSNPVDAVCGSTHYSCFIGTSTNNVAGSSTYTWTCNGYNGGASASCSESNSGTCTDGIQNGNETSIDMGGRCARKKPIFIEN